MSNKHNNDEFFATNFVDDVIKHCRKKFRMTNCNKIRDMNRNHNRFKSRNQFEKQLLY